MKCPNGFHSQEGKIITGKNFDICRFIWETCPLCSGTGRVTLLRWILAKIGATHVL